MIKNIKSLLRAGILLGTVTVLLTACSSNNDADTGEANSYQTITAEEAKKMMDDTESIIVLDVRTQEEYEEGHIKDSLLIPDYEITETAETVLTDKSAAILVYCRSGRRSANASQALADLGYENVYDFGGIIDWPYDVVTE